MNNKIFVLSLFAAACVSAATIDESSIEVTQDSSSQVVTVSYDLDGDAIVTMGVETNNVEGAWVKVDGRHVTALVGDVNKKVVSGDAREIKWVARKSWAQQALAEGKLRVRLKVWSDNNRPDYMAVDLRSGDIAYYATVSDIPSGAEDRIWKTERMLFRFIPSAGVEWRMGKAGSSRCREVSFSKNYYIGIYPITQYQGFVLKGDRSTGFTNETCWAERPYITSYQGFRGVGSDYSQWPNADKTLAHKVANYSFAGHMRKLTDNEYLFDLPTEAMWEYACRAGTDTLFNDGEIITDSENATRLKKLARYAGNSGYANGGTMPTAEQYKNDDTSKGTPAVGSYLPNAWGIYDMHGCVFEVCLDMWKVAVVPGDTTDPVGPSLAEGATEDQCVMRGGAWDRTIDQCNSYYRLATGMSVAAPNRGGRLAVFLP